ncbi:MAG: pyrroline-5-carboxylate reductase [Lachnospirales bacterium]
MKIGFIGCGNMAEAIISGIYKNMKNIEIFGFDINKEKCKILEKKYELKYRDINEILEVDYLFLAIKPNMYEKVIKEIKDGVNKSVIVTMAPGKTMELIEKYFNKNVKIIRTMSNTPAFVGEGMTAIACNKFIEKDEMYYIIEVFNSIGKCEVIEEKLFDAVVSVSGSSPAYIYVLIEAMADSAVRTGMARDDAYKFAAQAVYGSAKMVLETGEHPAKLKDNVCSPGGTTIEAVAKLEELGFRSAIQGAMEVCYNKSKSM